ncbi:MAG: glycosyltransferase family 4 protein [Candidatus Hydrogenedentes bacterium]|nr:glycosyltransferase family 4 protein [Candidatus Hydrogenedentota bacterium]
MLALHIHNYYRYRGGEDVMFERICGILRAKGHSVATFERKSNDISGAVAKIQAFVSSAYSKTAKAAVKAALREQNPDVVHVHNLYPLISPSALEACAEEGIPVVMRCPNYRMECPTGVLMRNGKVCTSCSGGREYMCAVTNCRGNIAESTAFAARNMLTRQRGLFHSAVDVFVPPSEFVKRRLIAAGFAAERITVVPNVVPLPSIIADPAAGIYVALAGRFSEEKGIETLLHAAKRLPNIPVRIAGEGPMESVLRSLAPSNVTFVGQLDREALAEFYARARFCVVPSRWYEAFGLVAAEAMSFGLPVVSTNMAGLAEIVDDGVTGLHFGAGDAATLAAHIERLWNDSCLCVQMGEAGRRKVEREYSEETYYTRLMNVYAKAMRTNSAPAVAGNMARIA